MKNDWDDVYRYYRSQIKPFYADGSEEVLKIIDKGKGFGLQGGICIACLDMKIVNGGEVNGRAFQGQFYHVTKADIRQVRIWGK